MKTKAFLILFATVFFSACTLFDLTDEIKGHAVIVDNFKDRNPLEGVYIELMYTKDEGYNYEFLTSTSTDQNGYFELDTKYKSEFFSIDSWVFATVYSDVDHTDTLGEFNFYFPEDTYSYETIYLDTFSLAHNIWVVPRINKLGNYQPEEISIDYYNSELVDNSLEVMTFQGPFHENQTFTPVEVKMTMNYQHWLSYGTRHLARGSLRTGNQEIGFGYFKLEDVKHTNEGDTLFIDFDVVEGY